MNEIKPTAAAGSLGFMRSGERYTIPVAVPEPDAVFAWLPFHELPAANEGWGD